MGNTDKQHGAGQLGSDRRYLVAVIGFTCLYAVCVSFFYSSWLVGRPGFAPTAFDNVLNPSILAASLLFSLLVRSKLPLGRTAYLAAGSRWRWAARSSPRRLRSTLPSSPLRR